MLRKTLIAATLLAGPVATGPALSQTLTPGRCAAMIAEDPDRARAEAARQRDLGGGVEASLCEADALAALGAASMAALRLEETALGPGLATDPTRRAQVLARAGDYWMEEGRLSRAIAAYGDAILLTPGDLSLYESRAAAHMADGNAIAAVQDLQTVLRAAPDRPDTLTLRAAALRASGDLTGALGDAAAATALAPDHAPAWYELGAGQAALGEVDAARESWLTAIDLDRGSVVALRAQAGLQSLLDQGD